MTPIPDLAAASAAVATLDAWLRDTLQPDALASLRALPGVGSDGLGDLADGCPGIAPGGECESERPAWTTTDAGAAAATLDAWLAHAPERQPFRQLARDAFRGIPIALPRPGGGRVTLGRLADGSRALGGSQ